jgi:hypothetical protein
VALKPLGSSTHVRPKMFRRRPLRWSPSSRRREIQSQLVNALVAQVLLVTMFREVESVPMGSVRRVLARKGVNVCVSRYEKS